MDFMKPEELPSFASKLKSLASSLWARALQIPRRAPKRLRLRESLPLGEHRFVAIVEVDGKGFLVGGTSNSLVLLAQPRKAELKPEGGQLSCMAETNITEIGSSDHQQGSEAC
jgi:flagellar biogenesis protein FliO